MAPSVLSAQSAIAAAFVDVLPAAAHVLDVGCGAGKFSVFVAERRPDVRVTGIDLAPSQLARAVRASRHLGDRARFIEGSALDLPFAGASFDGVLSCGSMKHWPDRARGLAECVRVLRPGGPLLVTEADRSCEHEDAASFVARWPVPAPLRPVFLALFRTWVAGQSIDLDAARALAAHVPLSEAQVGRVPGSPLLMISGRQKLAAGEHPIQRQAQRPLRAR